MITNLVLLVIAYLIGSIATSVWVGKIFYNIDVREHGSGNAGATNTIRVLGWKAGLPVFIIDALKGFAAVMLVNFSTLQNYSNMYVNFELMLGIAAVIGHMYPIFASFKGGKGVATLLGIVIALTPIPALCAFGVFLVVLLVFKYVSLGSMVAGVSYPFMLHFVFNNNSLTITIFSIVMSILLLFTHRKNIQRLLKGDESKASFLLGKK